MAIDPNSKSGYLQYLPAIYSEDPFLGRFLLAFEQVLSGLQGAESEPKRGLEEIIRDISRLFDPFETPADFLPWLAEWVAISLRADWTPGQKRDFLANIVPLYRLRGTKQGLERFVSLYVQGSPTIQEATGTPLQVGVQATVGVDTYIDGGAPHFFRVMVSLPAPDPATLDRELTIVKALIELQKPAHTTYELEPVHDTLKVGVRSTVGIDTLLGSIPAEV